MPLKGTMLAGIVAVFIALVLILLKVMPGPHKATDYLVIGTVATLVCILLAFVLFVSTSGKRSDMFFKRKK